MSFARPEIAKQGGTSIPANGVDINTPHPVASNSVVCKLGVLPILLRNQYRTALLHVPQTKHRAMT